MPVTDSSFVFRCATLHEGVMRRSADAFSDVICRGMSAAVWRFMVAAVHGAVWRTVLVGFWGVGSVGGVVIGLSSLGREICGLGER